ncbi:hypothetical protein DFP72DRAFT_1147103, partial [Ephemerocybe angulata]
MYFLYNALNEPIPSDIQDLILHYLPLSSLLALSKLPKMRPVVQKHLRLRVINLLRCFTPSPDLCLRMMRQTGTVISGSSALSVVAPGVCSPHDLNLYCPKGSARSAMQHLLALPGVRRESFPARMFGAERTHFSKLDVNCGIRKMYRFFHEETNKTITLFESIDSSPLVPILFFHSSVLMNYVDAREVVSFYSSLT